MNGGKLQVKKVLLVPRNVNSLRSLIFNSSAPA